VTSSRMPTARRSEAEARALAQELLEKLRAGGDWAAAKHEYSDDPPPGGPYSLSNGGVPPAGADEHPRRAMVRAFGDVAFSLEVGEIGLAEYDAKASPFGFHLIKRLK
jgi:parvulin-like peptidyl-prolyl isomerase